MEQSANGTNLVAVRSYNKTLQKPWWLEGGRRDSLWWDANERLKEQIWKP